MEFEVKEKRTLETCEKTLHDSQAEKTAAVHAERVQSVQQKAVTDEKWAAWVQQLQADQAKKQKEETDDLKRRIVALQQERMQQKLHVSEPVARSGALYQSQSSPLVSMRVPLPLLPSVQVLSVQHLSMCPQ